MPRSAREREGRRWWWKEPPLSRGWLERFSSYFLYFFFFLIFPRFWGSSFYLILVELKFFEFFGIVEIFLLILIKFDRSQSKIRKYDSIIRWFGSDLWSDGKLLITIFNSFYLVILKYYYSRKKLCSLPELEMDGNTHTRSYASIYRSNFAPIRRSLNRITRICITTFLRFASFKLHSFLIRGNVHPL